MSFLGDLIAKVDLGFERVAQQFSVATPPGMVRQYAGLDTPAGWLVMEGQLISRTTYAALLNAITFQTTVSTTSGSTTAAVTGPPVPSLITGGIAANQRIEGAGIPASAYVASHIGTSITLSAAATATASNVPVRIFPHGAGNGSTTFHVPESRARSIVGHYSGVTPFAELGGASDVVLQEGHLPPHQHAIDHNHTDPVIGFESTATCATTGTGIRVTDINDQTGGGGSARNLSVPIVPIVANSGNGPGASDPFSIMSPYLPLQMLIKT